MVNTPVSIQRYTLHTDGSCDAETFSAYTLYVYSRGTYTYVRTIIYPYSFTIQCTTLITLQLCTIIIIDTSLYVKYTYIRSEFTTGMQCLAYVANVANFTLQYVVSHVFHHLCVV